MKCLAKKLLKFPFFSGKREGGGGGWGCFDVPFKCKIRFNGAKQPLMYPVVIIDPVQGYVIIINLCKWLI